MNARIAKRLWIDRLATSFAWLATGLALLGLASILWTLFSNGFAGLNVALFSADTPAPGSPGGLRNAIAGSVLMTSIGLLMAIPVGILAGTWLAEYGRASKLGKATLFVNDILLSAPSIVIGLFVYGLIVVPIGHFSGFAGAVALGLLALPIIVRTTYDSLTLLPTPLREAALALGAPVHRMVIHVCYRAARMGLLTGALLSLARIAGETAPLLFTALNSQFFSLDMNAPLASLPAVIYRYAMSPFDDWNQLAWSGALLIALTVLGINLLLRALARPRAH
jgi:phosphate transport system permease protein